MNRRGIQPLGVVENDRRVDQETKYSSPHQVPETGGHEKLQRHSIESLGFLRELQGLYYLKANQRQRHHFQSRRHRPHGSDKHRRSRKVQVMQGTNHSATEVQNGGEVGGTQGRGTLEETQFTTEIGDRHGRKHFKEPFHPQMHHPPAPVLRNT